ncbi:MAG: type II toxin-antitoxin system Phd/YefM family antitoxin [Caldilineaceae bacterium]|nr:type II toxin-antitoxin system Phd/YefM family antitoxin [Caldilineaceae bacterium]
MTVTTWDSRAARENWRTLLDIATSGRSDIVITHHGQPAAALISYEDYIALQEELDELRAARRAEETVDAWRADRSIARPWSEVEAELVAKGLLDAEP